MISVGSMPVRKKRSILDRKNKTNSKKDLNDTTSSADYLKSNELCGYSLTEELQGYEREGMQLYLNDLPSRACEIVNACILAEESDYMRDFISDDQDHITGVRFICISEKQDFQI